ncbi:hypothetical protein GCM10027614_44170 [Micromonospora vulcania]
MDETGPLASGEGQRRSLLILALADSGPGVEAATSTQVPPLLSPRLDLRHAAALRFGVVMAARFGTVRAVDDLLPFRSHGDLLVDVFPDVQDAARASAIMRCPWVSNDSSPTR